MNSSNAEYRLWLILQHRSTFTINISSSHFANVLISLTWKFCSRFAITEHMFISASNINEEESYDEFDSQVDYHNHSETKSITDDDADLRVGESKFY